MDRIIIQAHLCNTLISPCHLRGDTHVNSFLTLVHPIAVLQTEVTVYTALLVDAFT